MVMSLFYYLPAVRPRMRERTVLRTYEGADKVNFISDTCFLLVLLSPGRVCCNQRCVCGWECPFISYYQFSYARRFLHVD